MEAERDPAAARPGAPITCSSDAPELTRLAAAGITSVLATPPGVLFRARARWSTSHAAGVRADRRRDRATPRTGLSVVDRRWRCTSSFAARAAATAIPESLLGGIAFVRQSFLDAQYQQMLEQRYQKTPTGTARPPFDPALDALQPALAGQLPVAFEAGLAARDRCARSTWRRSSSSSPIITGGREADLAADGSEGGERAGHLQPELSRRGRARSPPDADEPVRELATARARAEDAGGLAKAGVPFAFSGAGPAASRPTS